MINTNGFLISAASWTGSAVGSAKLDSGQWAAASFQASFSDATSTGSIKIQFSNDSPMGETAANFTPTVWSDVPGSTATATITSGATVNMYLPVNFVARWLRVNYTRSAGAGTFTVSYNALFT